jgi:hypothetical protein
MRSLDIYLDVRVVTYFNVVIGFQPQKENPSSIYITAEGDVIKKPG